MHMPHPFVSRIKRSFSPGGRLRPSGPVRRTLLVALAALAALGVAIVFALWFTVCFGGSCPSVQNLGTYDPDQAAKVFAADGRHITDLGLERRTVVPLAEMSPAVVAAFARLRARPGASSRPS